ncbi:MAG: hypothetical protein JWP11_3635 [Frankiales bacterium]|jgi:hypothetical protein|nr:hypothetical protein [Frankiales bacterium]
MPRVDDRDGVMTEVACRRCGTTVGVHKSSTTQTSVQWRGDSAATCTELAERRAAGQHPALVPRCESLTQSIDEAVRAGQVPVE